MPEELRVQRLSIPHRRLAVGPQQKAVIESFLADLEKGERLVVDLVVNNGPRNKVQRRAAVGSAEEAVQLLGEVAPGYETKTVFYAVRGWDEFMASLHRNAPRR